MSKLLILYRRNRPISQREEGLLKEQSGFLADMILQNFYLETVIGLQDAVLYFQYSGLPHLLRELIEFLNWMEHFLEHNEEGVQHLVTENDEIIRADVYIDCTGFRSMLLEE